MNLDSVRRISAFLFVLVACSGICAAQLNTKVQGKPVNGSLEAYRHLGERGGHAGDRYGQRLALDPRVVYQFQVRSYYYTPAVEIWNRDKPLATSTPLTPYYDASGYLVYISEVAFRPYRRGEHYLRVNSAERRVRSDEYVVAVYGYVVDDTEPRPAPPEPRPDPQPRPAPPPPDPGGPCRCPEGFEHWYGTVCVGIDAPETTECR